jgi:hypothetical protein
MKLALTLLLVSSAFAQTSLKDMLDEMRDFRQSYRAADKNVDDRYFEKRRKAGDVYRIVLYAEENQQRDAVLAKFTAKIPEMFSRADQIRSQLLAKVPLPQQTPEDKMEADTFSSLKNPQLKGDYSKGFGPEADYLERLAGRVK